MKFISYEVNTTQPFVLGEIKQSRVFI